MNKNSKRYFGTDGIRGAVGTNPITPDFMLKLGWAAGRVFSEADNGPNKILIGKDTRISGYMFEAALEAGADNVESDADSHIITCSAEDFNAVREALQEAFGDPEEAELTWIAQNELSVDEDQARTLLKFIDAIEDNDDVQSLSFNFEISDEIMAKIEA